MTKNLVIVALLTTNAVFAWYLWQSNEPGNPATSTMAADEATPTSSNTAARQPAETIAISAEQPSHQDIDFNGSYQDLSEQLRAQGFDETLVRQIVYADIRRQRMLLEQSQPNEYWRPSDISPVDELERNLAWQSEQRLMLLDLFGDEIRDDPMFEDLFKPLNRTLPFLSSDKQIALNEMNERRRANRQEMFQFGGAIRENGEELRESFQRYEERIKQMMTPEEYFEYQLRQSPLAYMMRRDLDEVIHTEQEFRDLFEIRNQDAVSMPPRAFAQSSDPQVQDQVRSYLGSDRFEAYQRAIDPRYRILKSIGERYENSETDIIRVYEEISDLEDEVNELRADQSLSLTDRNEKIEELREESYAKIERIAGSDTAASIRQNSRRLGLTGRGRRGGP